VQITNIGLTPITMPKEDKEWRFALAASPDTHGVLVAIHTDDGVIGLGYTGGAPHLGSGQEVVLAGLEKLRTGLIGCDPMDLVARLADCDRVVTGNNFAKAGIDLALHDLRAKALGVPLYQLLGGKIRSEIPILRIVAIKTPAEMARNSQKLVDEGYVYLKIKVEGDVEDDVARVAAIRQQVGPDVHLTIDANQSYDPKDAIRAIRRMGAYNIDLVEQPVHQLDLVGLRQVSQAVDVPVEADESAQTLEDIFRLVSERIVDSVSLKLGKLGGLRKAQQAAAICEAGHVKCRVGATVGSRIQAAAGLHFIAATPNMDYACELAEFARLLDDPGEGLEVENGRLRVPDGVGIGVQLRSPVELAFSGGR
jgi:L-alanine-DL-glutamate epimerase-like enolase superfamily enzyme